jgi:hypothetical protein
MFDPIAPRRPLQDADSEALRTDGYWDGYWAWLDATRIVGDSASAVLDDAEGAGRWCRLRDSADADYEAFHMRHSIGHSWDKYATFGDVFSLRSANGIPAATVLVASGAAVHAREQDNARLSPANAAALARFAEAAGFVVRPDDLPFDVLWDEAAPNLRFRYVSRDAENRKEFGDVVLEGRLSREEVEGMARTLSRQGTFVPSAVGLPDLGRGRGHEILSISFVSGPATHGLARDLMDAWEAASGIQWTAVAHARP